MIDSHHLYVQADGSNGDSAHRTGLVCALQALQGNLPAAFILGNRIVSELEISPGIFRRSPYGDTWDTDPRCFSRDQASRLVLAFAILGWKVEIRHWLKAMSRRGFYHQNNMHDQTRTWKFPDIMAPGEWCNVIRGLDLWWARPLLFFLDLNFIGMVYFRKKWDGASLYVPDLKYALSKYPTWTAQWAEYLNEKTPWLEEALNNHALANNGCVELQSLFKSLKQENRVTSTPQ